MSECEHRETKNFICLSCGENTYKYYKQGIEQGIEEDKED